MGICALQVRLPVALVEEADILRSHQAFDLSRAQWIRFCIREQHAREKARLAQEETRHAMVPPA